MFRQTAAEHEKKIAAERLETLARLEKDPFLGFENLESALSECRFASQPEVLARLFRRENIFISGLAGSGKTTVINRFTELIDAEYDGIFNIAVTASTGIAATLIGGTTIHSWAGLGISQDPFNPKDIPSHMWGRAVNLRTVDTLIIDEVSMLPAYLFTKLDAALRYFRRNDEPFGGVQLVLIGDFLQLPPVVRRGEEHIDHRYIIETQAWKDAKINYCFLDKSYRATDDRLKKMLTEIATGRITEHTRGIIKERQDGAPKESAVYTTLFTTNANVEKYNLDTLKNSSEKSVFFPVEATFGDKKDVAAAIKKFNVPEMLEFKKGATVILTKNIQTGRGLIANGSLGVIEGFATGNIPIVRFNQGGTHLIPRAPYSLTERVEKLVGLKKTVYENTKATVQQVPLKLGYAITVHKSQGQTFDGVTLDLSKCFQPGLGYVALSRVRTVDDLVITGFSEKAFDVSEKSMKITVFVKKKSLVARAKFLEDQEAYEMLLTSDLYRGMFWNKENASAVLARNNLNNSF